MSLVGCQIILIDLNFHLQNVLEIFCRNSGDKIQSKNKAKQSFSNDREHGKLKTFFNEQKQIRHVTMTFAAI